MEDRYQVRRMIVWDCLLRKVVKVDTDTTFSVEEGLRDTVSVNEDIRETIERYEQEEEENDGSGA